MKNILALLFPSYILQLSDQKGQCSQINMKDEQIREDLNIMSNFLFLYRKIITFRAPNILNNKHQNMQWDLLWKSVNHNSTCR